MFFFFFFCREDNSRKIKKWHLFFVPFKSLLCEEYLKVRIIYIIGCVRKFQHIIVPIPNMFTFQNKGVFGSLTSVEQISHCLIFPFDNDLMSMEIESAFKVSLSTVFLNSNIDQFVIWPSSSRNFTWNQTLHAYFKFLKLS